MKLSDVHIQEKMQSGEINITPNIGDDQIGSMSIDLRLGNRFGVFKHVAFPFIDVGMGAGTFAMSEDVMSEIEIADTESFFLHPGEMALGITIEHVSLADDIVGCLDGRSSLARLGLLVHVTAHTIDPGWDGRITLEFVNIGRLPLALRPGMRICAISFEPLSGPTSRPYSKKRRAKYQHQDSPLPSRIESD
jgi:dCTP deaminase